MILRLKLEPLDLIIFTQSVILQRSVSCQNSSQFLVTKEASGSNPKKQTTYSYRAISECPHPLYCYKNLLPEIPNPSDPKASSPIGNRNSVSGQTKRLKIKRDWHLQTRPLNSKESCFSATPSGPPRFSHLCRHLEAVQNRPP